MTRILPLVAALLLAPAAALAAKPVPAPAELDRIMITIPVFGADACPKSTGDEIIVCARLPEGERYRLPKRFRGRSAAASGGSSWTNQVSTLETVSRQGIPNSCSPNGSNGFTGCFTKFQHEWYEERQEMKKDADATP